MNQASQFIIFLPHSMKTKKPSLRKVVFLIQASSETRMSYCSSLAKFCFVLFRRFRDDSENFSMNAYISKPMWATGTIFSQLSPQDSKVNFGWKSFRKKFRQNGFLGREGSILRYVTSKYGTNMVLLRNVSTYRIFLFASFGALDVFRLKWLVGNFERNCFHWRRTDFLVFSCQIWHFKASKRPIIQR